jgi:hypothetical protein
VIALTLRAVPALITEINALLPTLTKKMTGELPSKFITSRNARAVAVGDAAPEQVHVPTLAYVTLRAMKDKARATMAVNRKRFEMIVSYDAAMCVKMELTRHRNALETLDRELGSELFGVLLAVSKYTSLVEEMDNANRRTESVRHNQVPVRERGRVRRQPAR